VLCMQIGAGMSDIAVNLYFMVGDDVLARVQYFKGAATCL
jgi:hypothetical protein